MKKPKFNTVSFCSLLGNFAYAYPSDNNNGLTMKQIFSSPYTSLFYNTKTEATDAMNKMKDILKINK